MNKALPVVLVLVLAGVGVRGYFMYQQMHGGSAADKAKAMAAARQVAAKPTPAPTPDPAKAEIDSALKAMHVTTIMPGDPGLVIIDKVSHAEGEDLSLPKSRKAHIAAISDTGVALTCNGMAFHLDPPAAPDLDAIRKPH